MTPQDLVIEIDRAIEAHAAWKQKLTAAINEGRCEQSPEEIGCDDKCAFGKWLYGESLDAETKARKPYEVTRRLHAEFHQVAGKVARLAETGDRGVAFQLMDGEYSARSDILSRALKKWRSEVAPWRDTA